MTTRALFCCPFIIQGEGVFIYYSLSYNTKLPFVKLWLGNLFGRIITHIDIRSFWGSGFVAL